MTSTNRVIRPSPVDVKTPQIPEDISPGSDAANAFILLENGFQDMFRYVEGLGWRSYHKGQWRDVVKDTHIVSHAASYLAGAVADYKTGVSLGKDHKMEQKALDQWFKAVCMYRVLRDTLNFLCSMPQVFTRLADWDKEPHLLNVLNGVLDLRTGQLLPHSPNLLLFNQCNANYDPEATDAAVNKLLETFKEDGREPFMAQQFGKALYGAVLSEEFVVYLGPGKTGKSTTMSAMMYALGSYAVAMPVQSLLRHIKPVSGNTPRPELVRLAKKRLVTATEPPQGAKLNAAEVKALTGRDILSVRSIYKKQIEFTPVFSLWIQTNYDLHVEFDDSGMQRRMVIVPFNKVVEQERETFKMELQTPSAAAALLAWGVRGFQTWYGDGQTLNNCKCEVVEQATSDYWQRMNPLGEFFTSYLVADPNSHVVAGELEKILTEWITKHGLGDHPNANVIVLRKYMWSIGAFPKKVDKVRCWKGVALKNDD